MRAAVSFCGALWVSVSLLPAASEHGVSAEIVPAQVRPGDLFELRVGMSRSDYAKFELHVPTHERLHRVAVESVPVSLVDGRYRQSEIWFLQADSSGEVVMDGATVSLESKSGPVLVELPPLRVEVMSYGEQDESAEPAVFPAVSPEGGDWWRDIPVIPVVFILMILTAVLVFGVLLVVLLVVWRMVKGGGGEGPGAGVPLDAVLADLDSGTIAPPALERLMWDQGGSWSGELREAVEAALYAGRGEARRLAAMLREEVAR